MGGVICISYIITFFGWIPFVWEKKTAQGNSLKFHDACNYNINFFCCSNGKHFFHVSNFRAGTQETGQRSSGGSPIGRSA